MAVDIRLWKGKFPLLETISLQIIIVHQIVHIIKRAFVNVLYNIHLKSCAFILPFLIRFCRGFFNNQYRSISNFSLSSNVMVKIPLNVIRKNNKITSEIKLLKLQQVNPTRTLFLFQNAMVL